MKIMEHRPPSLKNIIRRYEAWSYCNFATMNFTTINEVKIQEDIMIMNVQTIKTELQNKYINMGPIMRNHTRII